QQGVVEVISKEAVTHDMRHLVVRLLEPDQIKFFPGQYMDFTIPGTDAVRSFSMANTTSRDTGLLEFVIKVYPDGQFSRFLAEKLAEGDRLDIPVRSASSPCVRATTTWCSWAAGRVW